MESTEDLSLGMVTIVVDDYQKAVDYYTKVLGFQLTEFEQLSPEKFWVVVSAGKTGIKILLAKANSTEQLKSIGNQTGGRVGFFLYTRDFAATYTRLLQHNVTFVESPRLESFGQVVVFSDLYGNKWDLIERTYP